MIKELENHKNVYWRLVSMDPVYTDKMVSKETGYTTEEVEEFRDKFLMIYHWFSRYVGTNKFFELLKKARDEEEEEEGSE